MLYEPPMGGVLAPPAQIARWRDLTENGQRDQMVKEFLHEIGGYTPAEIGALRDKTAWEGRLAAAPTVARELEAEQGNRIDREALKRLSYPALLLVGSRSPAWAVRSTDAYAKALDGVGAAARGSRPRRRRRRAGAGGLRDRALPGRRRHHRRSGSR